MIANAGKIITYAGAEYTIIESGIKEDGTPYADLKPENEELSERMRAEIRKFGSLTVRTRRGHQLVLGEDEYPISAW